MVVMKALGDCIGLAVYEHEAMVGGILQYMLPNSKKDPAVAQRSPLFFADTGIPHSFNECCRLAAVKSWISGG